MKRIALFPAHPSQVWVLKSIADAVKDFAEPVWVLRDKDVSVSLADALGLDYTLISRASSGLVGNALELAANTVRCWHLTRQRKIDLWVTKYGCGNIAATLAGRTSVSFTDDDIDLIPLAAWTSYPFARVTLTTKQTRMGRFESKAVRFPSVAELTYLHPNRFQADPGVRAELGLGADDPYVIVRLSALKAHHDAGVRGIDRDFMRGLVDILGNNTRLLITSEKPLDAEFEPFRSPVPVHRIQHALAFADAFIGDGQTMATEAAMLGTPAFRINDFVGRISSIANVEEYGLSHGFRPDDYEEALEEIERVLAMPNRQKVYERRRAKYLADHIDPLPCYVHTIRMVLEGTARTEIQAWAEENDLCQAPMPRY